MKLKIRAEIRMTEDRTAEVLARIAGLSDEHMAAFAHDIVVQARENVANIQWEESTGTLGREIHDSRLGKAHYQIETTSGYASYQEFGTQYIQGKHPFLWPAYRAMKKKFFRMSKWI